MDFSENADKKVSIYIDVLFFLEYALIITIMYVVPSTFLRFLCLFLLPYESHAIRGARKDWSTF